MSAGGAMYARGDVMALRIEHVSKSFGTLQALVDVDLEFPHGLLICLLGPSGCGKTTLLRCIAGLEAPSAGRVRLDGEDLTDTPAHKRNFGMVFQSLALFPHLSVGENIAYGLRIRGAGQAACRQRAEELLELVRLPGVTDRPVSQLSGGQRQRVAIARALAVKPALIVCDEPVSALDVSVQAQILNVLTGLRHELGVSYLFITHDLAVVRQVADRICVLYKGEVVEEGLTAQVLDEPTHPYTIKLIESVPRSEPDWLAV
jgi:putative spermidine/putrescine transport system ATP-binding protein